MTPIFRGPPLWDDCDAQVGDEVQTDPDWDLAAQPAPDCEVDQRITWCNQALRSYQQMCQRMNFPVFPIGGMIQPDRIAHIQIGVSDQMLVQMGNQQRLVIGRLKVERDTLAPQGCEHQPGFGLHVLWRMFPAGVATDAPPVLLVGSEELGERVFAHGMSLGGSFPAG